MKFFPFKTIKLALFSCATFLCFSCSKDTDLLADYVISENLDAYFLKNYVIDDNFITAGDNSVVLDVLSNDTFIDLDKVKIVKTSDPASGSVTINEDKTLTYQPGATSNEETGTEEESEQKNTAQSSGTSEETDASDVSETTEGTGTQQEQEAPKETGTSEEASESNEDTFTYTVETTNEAGSKETKEGTVTIALDYGELKAFPGAEGYGKFTTGGRGGRVLKVINLNDSGSGSLRAAVEASGSRTVVFSVSGYIKLVKPLRIRNSDITIAGQTAPGGGITLRDNGIEILTSNVIVRYLRVRPGIGSSEALDAIRVIQFKDDNIMKNIIIDHCSLSWARDEVLSFGVNRAENAELRNITVQNCIISEAIDNQYGVLVMGNVTNTSFNRNYLAHNKDRQFRASTSITEFEVINNIIYNFRWGTQVSYGGKFDIINNVYKISDNINPQSGNAMTYISSNNTPDAIAEDGEVHQSGNMIINSDYTDTNKTFRNYNRNGRVHSNSFIEPMATENLDSKILADVGASLFDDPVDKRVISDYKNSTGNIITSETQVGGYPNLKFVKREDSYDKDNDGMEDNWELENGLNPTNADDAKTDKNNDGFTNLEDFLHGLTLAPENGNPIL